MAIYYVGSQAEFASAINSGTYPITIYATQNFTDGSGSAYNIFGDVTIASSNSSPYTISNVNIIAGEGSALSLTNITFDGTNTDTLAAVENYGNLLVDGNSTIKSYLAPAIFNGKPGSVEMYGKLTGNDARGYDEPNGGGVLNYSTLNVEDGSEISGNYANDGGGIWTSSDTGVTTINGGTISNNTADNNGGGIYNGENGTLTLNNGTIADNTTSGNGGGVYNGGYFEMDGGIISGNTAEYNGGGIENQMNLTVNAGEISNNTANNGGGGGIHIDPNTVNFSASTATVADNTAPDGGGMYISGSVYASLYEINFSGNHATNNGGAIYMDSSPAVEIGGTTTFDTNSADSDGGAIYVPYENLFGLMVDSGVVFNNNGARFQSAVVDEDLDMYHSQVQATQFTNNLPDGYNNLDIAYNRAQADIYATKTIEGGSGEMPTFTFNLADVNGDPVSMATNQPDGSITFPHFVGNYDEAPYLFDMFEDQEIIAGYTPDPNSYMVNVNIDNVNGVLTASVIGAPEFVNVYNPTPTTADIDAHKNATGKDISGGEFVVNVTNGVDSYNVSNDASGNFKVPISFDASGTFTYTISETSAAAGWAIDTNTYEVTVNVTDDGEGGLTAEVTYNTADGEAPTFVNTYTNTPASVSLSATKLAFGKPLTAGLFTFGVFDNEGNLKVSTTNNADGTINYPPVTFSEAGTYYYYLQEITPSGGGWTTDIRKDPVVITVTENGQGQLVASVLYPYGAASFRNQYGLTPAVVTPTATKTAEGATLPAGRFTFGLYHPNTRALVDTATNTAEGDIVFGDLTFDSAGTYVYEVREITPKSGGWTPDATVYTATVTVTDDGSGVLSSSISFDPSAPVFNNVYDPSDTSEDIYGYKVLDNWDGGEVTFEFALTQEDGTVVDTTTSSGGVIHFTTSALTSTGTYQYIMKETSTGGNGWTVDSATFPVTVTVTDDGSGKLISTVDYPNGTPTFVNHYETTPASIVLTGTKAAVGRTLAGNDFIFGVYDEEGNIQASAYNDESGAITFPEIYFDAAGVYNYTVRELSVDQDGWITDKNNYPVTITVVDNGDGTFSVSAVRYVRGMPTFTNHYTSNPASVTLYAAKYATGKGLQGGEFDFAVTDASGNVLCTATNDGSGSVSFPAVVFNETGVYNYNIVETTASGNGWTTDRTVIPVTVTVSDDGQGQLNASVSYPAGVPHFNNVYSQHTVAFNSNGGSAVASETVPSGNAATEPADPTKQGFSFCGWFTDAALTVPYDFDTPVTADITLYACWNAVVHEVDFDSKGGSAVDSQFVPDGYTADEPYPPTRDGYSFCGWYSDEYQTTKYDFNTPVTADLTLYACWYIDMHFVTFDSNGGSAVADQIVEDGEAATRPTDPTKEGYTFCGWFTDAALTVPYDFSTPVTADITLYACWKKIDPPSKAVHVACVKCVCGSMTAGQFCLQLHTKEGAFLATATPDQCGNIYFDSRLFAEGTHCYTLCLCPDRKKLCVTKADDGTITVHNPPVFTVDCRNNC